MLFKSVAILAALVVPALAYEPVTCKKNATQDIIVSIDSATNFCTMLTGYGVNPVAPNEGCASSYCYGPSTNGKKMPDGYILSANYVKTATYSQITGCMNSTVWGQNPNDEGGQMDSHGWPYACAGYNKFVSLLEPSTNTFCIRCCTASDNSECDTSHSTNGCMSVIPGKYTMADGSQCPPPGSKAKPTTTTTTKATSTTSGATTTTTSGSCTSCTRKLGQGDGKTGQCCKVSNDCVDTCNSNGLCGPSDGTGAPKAGSCSSATTTTTKPATTTTTAITTTTTKPATTTTTTKPVTTTTTTTKATTTTTTGSGACCTRKLGQGDGKTGQCCTVSNDCVDTCNSNGLCGPSDGSGAPKAGSCGSATTTTKATTTTTKATTTTTKATTTTTAPPSTCTRKLGQGDGKTGQCCRVSNDCIDTCNSNGLCGVSDGTGAPASFLRLLRL